MNEAIRCSGFPADTYAFYALEVLEDRERTEIDEHLRSGCETCAAELNRASQLWFSVGAATRQAEPPARLRQRVLNAVSPVVPISRFRWRSFNVLAVAALVLLAFSAGSYLAFRITDLTAAPGSGIAFSPVYAPPATPPQAAGGKTQVVVKEVPTQVADPSQASAINTLTAELVRERERSQRLETELGQQRTLAAAARDTAAETERKYRAASVAGTDSAEVRTQLATITSRAADLERQVTQYKVLVEAQRRRLDQTMKIASMVSDPSLRVVRLRATEKDRNIEAHAAIATGSRMVFYASRLPVLPANRVYQLWLVRSSGAPVASAGIFSPDPSRNALLQLQDPVLLTGVTALAVTDEPAGGSPQPTGHKWLIGS